jgi:ABC-type nitrate/sulfonate/bicarbonate transport system substrate-binding protein
MLAAAACGDDSEDAGDKPDGGGSPTQAPPDKLTFMAGFKPQANLPFVGVYVAQEKGFFEEQNLEVRIEHVTTPGDNFRFLAAGEIQITTSDASALLEKHVSDPRLDIVSLALIGQRGQQGFSVLADSGIESPADWAGKTVGYKGSQVTPDYLAILAANGVDRGSLQEVKVGFDPRILTEGQVDVFPVFVSNEPDTLRKLGYEVKTWEAADFGAPTLGLTYAAMRDWVADHEDVTQRFINAVLDGIDYADLNRDEAVDIVMKYAPDEDREHQQYMLETELEMALPTDVARIRPGEAAAGCVSGLAAGCPRRPSQPAFGLQTETQWQKLHDFMVQYGALSGPIDDVALVFTDRFVKAYYEALAASASPTTSP